MAGGETTLYLHDLDGNVISEVDGSGTVRRDYVWVEHRGTSSATQAPGTALPLVQVTGLDTPGQEIAWIHTDHQNRQVILTNATGGLVRTVVTTPFGMLARDSGQTVHQTSAGFAGQWKLPEAGTNGLQYNWHRHYDPTLGRYTQPDPLGLIDGPSRYGYALQNPVRFEDPRGTDAQITYWSGAGWGRSSFGHGSISVNDQNWSWGPGGMSKQSRSKYNINQQKFRSGNYGNFRLTPNQDNTLAQCLDNYKGIYNPITRNCLAPIQFCMAQIGMPIGNDILPSSAWMSLLGSNAPSSYGHMPQTGEKDGSTAPWVK